MNGEVNEMKRNDVLGTLLTLLHFFTFYLSDCLSRLLYFVLTSVSVLLRFPRLCACPNPVVVIVCHCVCPTRPCLFVVLLRDWCLDVLSRTI